MRWRSFPLQFLALILIPTAIVLILFTAGNLYLHQQAMRDMVGERDLRSARAAAAAIGEQLDHRAAAIRSLSDQLRLADDPAAILANLDHYALDFQGGVAFFPTTGELMATGPPPAWLSQNLNDATPVGRNPRTGAVFLSLPGSGELLLVAVENVDGEATVGAFYPGAVARRALVDVFDAPGAARAVLLDAGGSVVFASHEPAGSTALDHNRRVQLAALQRGTQYVTVDDQEFVVAFAPVEPLGWTLVIEEPWQAVTDPLLEGTAVAPLVLIPVLLLAVLGVWIGVRQVVQPLQRLEEQATALAWGDYAAVEEPVGGIQEIRRLQQELAHMAGKVRQAQQSLRGYLGAVTTGQEEERRRLARELHDDTIQSLIALRQQAQWLELTLDGDDEARPTLERMTSMAEETIDNLRRLIRDLRPIYLEDLGLVPALEMLTRDTGRLLDIPVTFDHQGAPHRLDPRRELVLYRIAQEALSNVARHAAAASARVSLHFGPDQVVLTVQDDGRGFRVPDTPAEMGVSGHYGLLGIQERAELIGARLELESAPGAGTTLRVTLTGVAP